MIAPDAPGIAPPDTSRSTPPPTVLRGIAKSWPEIRLCLIDRTTVRVDAGDRRIRCSHVDFGMAHRRTRMPTLVWEVIEETCNHGGFFKTSRFSNSDATKRLISRVSRDLQTLFGIDGSPFYRYRSDCGWRSRFLARPDLPDDTPP
jgi:hypothetical protein